MNRSICWMSAANAPAPSIERKVLIFPGSARAAPSGRNAGLDATIASVVAKEIEKLQPGEGLERIAKALSGKIERTKPVKRLPEALPAGLTAPLLQQAFTMPKGGVASLPTADGRSRTIFRVADVIAAPSPTEEEAAAIKTELTRQMRVDVIDQYVSGLRARYGYTVDEKKLVEALGGQPEVPVLDGIELPLEARDGLVGQLGQRPRRRGDRIVPVLRV